MKPIHNITSIQHHIHIQVQSEHMQTSTPRTKDRLRSSLVSYLTYEGGPRKLFGPSYICEFTVVLAQCCGISKYIIFMWIHVLIPIQVEDNQI
jgi:hypothetical protein